MSSPGPQHQASGVSFGLPGAERCACARIKDKDMKSKNESSEIITSMSCDDEKVLTQSELRTHKRRMTEYAKQLYRKKNNAVVEGLTKAIGSNDFVVLQQNDDQEEWSLKTIVNVEITYENEPRIEVDWKLENVSFEKLQNLEKKYGFKESYHGIFFRKGKVGNWKKELNIKISSKIEQVFEKEMKELGYL